MNDETEPHRCATRLATLELPPEKGSASSLGESRPYADKALDYLRKGFSPLPLPTRRKFPPPTGWTGYAAPYASGADVTEWASHEHAASNIGLRLPETVIGLDIDAYGSKSGEQTMREAIDRLGALPRTYVSTSRDDISGIRLYRVPAGRCWADTLGAGVEVIHHGHRYVVAAPSLHPEGRVYRWRGPDGAACEPPAVADLPSLPQAWVDQLDAGGADERACKIAVSSADVERFVADVPGGEPCRYLTRLLDEAQNGLRSASSRHDLTRNYVAKIVRAAEQGHRGASDALDTLGGLFAAAVADDRQRDPHEFSRMVSGAVALVRAEPTSPFEKGCCPAETQAGDAGSAEALPGSDDEHRRSLSLTPASRMRIRPVHWLWTSRIALGTLALLGGREGVGKSTIAYTIAADVTRGRLPGRFEGVPKAVIVAATEDSWEHTIVPRLMAANADLDRVFRVDVTTSEGVDTSLSLPRDLVRLREATLEADAGLILLDPLMSRLDVKLDSHKDAEVRIALEPLVTLADRCGVAILGLIHVNKSTQADPVNLLMGSRAFGAVARAVLFVMRDPDDDQLGLLGQPKNNLGRTDLPTLTFRINSQQVADTDEGPVWTSRIVWQGERSQSIAETLETAADSSDARSATSEAADWLSDYLTAQGGIDDSATIKREGHRAGHSVDALKRARKRLRAVVESQGFPRRTYWALPGSQPPQSGQSVGESAPTALTAPTESRSAQSGQSAQSADTPTRCARDCCTDR